MVVGLAVVVLVEVEAAVVGATVLVEVVSAVVTGVAATVVEGVVDPGAGGVVGTAASFELQAAATKATATVTTTTARFTIRLSAGSWSPARHNVIDTNSCPERVADDACGAPSPGFEPGHMASEANALSPELRGRGQPEFDPGGMSNLAGGPIVHTGRAAPALADGECSW